MLVIRKYGRSSNNALRASSMWARLSLRSRIATSFCSRIVSCGSLGKRLAGRQRRLARSVVEREVELRLVGHVPLEVRQAPRDRHAETRGVERVAVVERDKRLLEALLRRGRIGRLQRRGHDLVVQRRDDHEDALALGEAEVDDVLLGRQRTGRTGLTRGRRRQPVDELVDARPAEGTCSCASQKAATGEPHQPCGRTSTRLRRSRSRFVGIWRYVYGAITCSLTV